MMTRPRRKILTILFAALLIALAGSADAQQGSTTTLPSPPKPLQTCRACSLDREACYARCDKQYKTDTDKLKCVNACNARFRCIEGDDCR
jgi:hypothetical protein